MWLPYTKIVSPVKEEVKPKPTVVVVKPPSKANLTVKVTSPNKIVPSAPKIVNSKTVISPQKIVIEKPSVSPAKALLSPTTKKTIIVEKPLINASKISLAKPTLAPKIISDVKVQNRVAVANVSKITLEPPKKVSPLVQQKPLIINNEKPVIAGLGSKPVIGGVTKITKNIVLSKPVSASSNTTNPSSPLKVGTKIVTLNQKQESPIKLPSSSITLASKDKEEKQPLTISLESSRKTTIKPIVKTVEIPKRVSKMTGGVVVSTSSAPKPASSIISKPVVRLDVADKKVVKAPSLEIKLDTTKPALQPLSK